MNQIECSCAMDVDWNEGDVVFPERLVRAKKIYKCVECSCQIQIGELHQVLAGVCEGDFWTARTCITCSRIRETYCHDGWQLGRLRSHLLNCLGIDYVTGELAKWAKDEDDKCREKLLSVVNKEV